MSLIHPVFYPPLLRAMNHVMAYIGYGPHGGIMVGLDIIYPYPYPVGIDAAGRPAGAARPRGAQGEPIRREEVHCLTLETMKLGRIGSPCVRPGSQYAR